MVLFVGGTFTVSAIGHFQTKIASVGYLETFIAMIISCGGNSGSQASTLVIRAMALGEVRLRDWWRVFVRECAAGLALGAILGTLGLLRIVAWHFFVDEPDGSPMYGKHYLLLGATVALAVMGVATWGTLVGALLPFALKRLGLDPASASAPLVATLSDVTGIMIFFSIALAVLSGTLL
jgi:magnesium transporter